MSKPTTEGRFLLPFQRRNNLQYSKCHVYAYVRPDSGPATRNVHVMFLQSFTRGFGAAKTLGVTKLLIDIITLRCCTEEAKLLSQLSLVRLHHSDNCRLVACECLDCCQGDCGQSFNEEGTDLKQSMEMTVVAYILLWNDLKISQTNCSSFLKILKQQDIFRPQICLCLLKTSQTWKQVFK